MARVKWERPEVFEARVSSYEAGVLGIEPGVLIRHRLSTCEWLAGPYRPINWSDMRKSLGVPDPIWPQDGP